MGCHKTYGQISGENLSPEELAALAQTALETAAKLLKPEILGPESRVSDCFLSARQYARESKKRSRKTKRK